MNARNRGGNAGDQGGDGTLNGALNLYGALKDFLIFKRCNEHKSRNNKVVTINHLKLINFLGSIRVNPQQATYWLCCQKWSIMASQPCSVYFI